MKKILIVAVLISASSCYTQKQARRQVDKIERNYPDVLAGWCADAFEPDIRYRPGEVIVKTDTTYLPGDSVDCPPNGAGQIVKVKCPDNRIVYVDRLRVDTFENINTAALAVKDSAIVALRIEKGTVAGKLKTWQKVAGVLGILSLILAVGFGLILKFK